MKLIVLALIIYLFGAFTQYFFKENQKCNYLIAINTLATLLAFGGTLGCFVSQNYSQDLMFEFGNTLVNVVLSLDGLSAFFILIIALVSWLAMIYSKGYLAKYVAEGRSVNSHYFCFNLFVVAMILVVLSQNVFAFLIAWEIMSFSSFLLMLFDADQKSVRKTAMRYLVTMHIGVLFLIAGFVMLNIKTGSIWFFDFNGQVTPLIYGLLFVGFGIKAGLVPVHTWLPKAHPVAPSHISALMSGVMIKTGIYGILRMTQLLNEPSAALGYAILAVGLMSSLLGILYATGQRDFKKMLAYSSIENMGIITLALGLGILGIAHHNVGLKTLGFLGCFMHIINHAVFKPLMFFAAGAVYNKAHTKDMEKLGGLAKVMPNTALCFLIGSMALCALPPFNGFISEFLIYYGFLNAFNTPNYLLITVMILSMAGLAFVGATAIVAFTGAYSTIFLGTPRTEKAIEVKSEVPLSMVAPMVLLVVILALIGLFPQYSILLIGGATNELVQFLYPVEILGVISFFNITLVITIGVLLLVRKAFLSGKTVTVRNTWGCGYNASADARSVGTRECGEQASIISPPFQISDLSGGKASADARSAKVQYTSTSFTRPFLGFLNPFYVRVMEFKQIKDLFPEKTSFKSKIYDIFEYYIINPVIKIDENFLAKFLWIQSGNIQSYLWYGIVALSIAIGLVLGGKI